MWFLFNTLTYFNEVFDGINHHLHGFIKLSPIKLFLICFLLAEYWFGFWLLFATELLLLLSDLRFGVGFYWRNKIDECTRCLSFLLWVYKCHLFGSDIWSCIFTISLVTCCSCLLRFWVLLFHIDFTEWHFMALSSAFDEWIL